MAQDLFTFYGEQELRRNAPLADRLRPTCLEDFFGQGAILAEGRLLRRAIAADRVGNLLLYGPPGVGKTTLAKIIAANTRSHFSVLNAVLAGVKELRQEVQLAKQRLENHSLRTILFIDEVHRFNSTQQDALLPWVENGTLTLIGATTENPFFEVNKALVSRSRVFRLQLLNSADLYNLLNRALTNTPYGYGDRNIELSDSAAAHLVDISNGDARSLLNALELAVESTPPDDSGFIKIDLEIAEDSIQERAVLYDKQGDCHFDTISAFIKSLRGSDPDASLFWLARMIEAGENPRFIFRRMLIAASEDIGLADPQAIVVVQACASAFERIGLPEGLYTLAQATLYLASTAKSNSISGFFEAQNTVRSFHQEDIPSHLKDPHRDGKTLGDGVGYQYPHSFPQHWVAQPYLPKTLQGEVFWKPTAQGWEGERRNLFMQRRAAQLASSSEFINEHPFFGSDALQKLQLEKWMQRQLTQEGDRLQELLRRLWLGVRWQSNHRVLMLGCDSLFWAIKPITEVLDGGVTILVKTEDDQERLFQQLEFLDLNTQPLLLEANKEVIKELPEDLKFEIVGGRFQIQDERLNTILNLFPLITQKCVRGAELKLLISYPTIGPARSLSYLYKKDFFNNNEEEELSKVIELENKFLTSIYKKNIHETFLEKLKWDIQIDQWEENINLHVTKELEMRWLEKGADYYNLLSKNDLIGSLNIIRRMLQLSLGRELQQKLIHIKYTGRLLE